MSKIKITLISLLCVIILIGVSFAGGMLDVLYKSTVGVKTESAKRKIYKENKSHVEGMVKDLANYKMQYETTESEKEKTAIKSRIINDFANFDIAKIDNTELQVFLERMRGF